MITSALALTTTALYSGLNPTAEAMTANSSALDTKAMSGEVNGEGGGVDVVIWAEGEGGGSADLAGMGVTDILKRALESETPAGIVL